VRDNYIVMKNIFKVSSNKVRPWGAVFLTTAMLLETMFLLIVFGASLNQGVYYIIPSTISLLLYSFITYGCWFGRNWAWAWVIIAQVIGLIRISGVQIDLFGSEDAGRYPLALICILILVVTFLPKTKAFYIAEKGKINHLSVSPKRLVKYLLIFIVSPIVLFILFILIGSLLDM
jgi:hypothetical protein